MMGAKTIAEKALRELHYDFHSFTIEGFISFTSKARCREIITIPWRMPANLFGFWVSDDEEPREYIFYRDDVPVIHQVHIQLHELAHFLLGHRTLRINRNQFQEAVENNVPLPFSDLARLRSSDKTDLEKQAETLAALIQKQVIQDSSMDHLMNDLSTEAKLANFLRIMGFS